MEKINPLLWFNTEAEEAAKFYVSIFKNSKILNVSYYGDAGPGPKGEPLMAEFELQGQKFMALNMGKAALKTPSTAAFFVNCETQEEVDELWEKLSEGGKKDQCGWLHDKYGTSWNIVPTMLGKLMSDPDPVKTQRVFKAMLGMTKLEIKGLQEAYDKK